MEKNDLRGKTILLVNAGSIKKRFILQRLKKLGLNVICLNKEKAAVAAPYVDHWVLADLNNYKDCIQALKLFAASHPTISIDGAFTFWEESVLLTSKIIDVFGLIGIPFEIANIARNKYLFREFCQRSGLPAPRHQILHRKEDIRRLNKNLHFPLVIKPQYGSSSAFVVRVENKEELAEAYDFVKGNIKSHEYAPDWETLEVFVEEYIDGDEVDIDILLQNGKIKFYCISDNYNKSRERFFVDSGQAIPSSLPEKEQNDLIEMTEEILEKLGIQNGCIHFEAKSTKNGPVPLEINMRLGGDYIPAYIKGAWGVDLVDYTVKIALGQHFKIEQHATPDKYIIGWDLYPEHSGILVELNIDPALEKRKYLEEIHIYKEIGDAVLLPPEGNDGLGWLTVSGDNLLDAQDNLKEALKCIAYKVVGFDSESVLGKTARKDRFSAAVMKKNLLLKASKMEKVRQVPIENQRNLHIGIAGNLLGQIKAKQSIPSGILDIANELNHIGYETTLFDFNSLNRATSELKRSSVDLIFNATEGINNDLKLRPQAAAILEAMQLPFTGSSSLNLALSRDKIRTKKLLAFHNIPTPAWDYAYSLEDTIDENLRYPLIVKPGTTDNSCGITNDSVVTNKQELERQLKRIIVDIGQPALVEEYIEGDEYYVSILGSSPADFKVLPLSRSNFKKLSPRYWHIYSEEAKEQTNPVYKKIIVERPVKNISAKLEALLTEIALDTYQILRCRDYGSVEIRVDKDDNPYVLELNPNPTLHSQSALIKSAKLVGLTYGQVLEEIIKHSIERLKRKTLYPKFLE
jgi:D-alanine-D-alanine ligase